MHTHTDHHTHECTAQACKSHSQCSYQWIPRSRLKVIAITTVQSAGTTFHTVCEGNKVSSLIGIAIKTNSLNNSVVLSHWVNRHPPPEVDGEANTADTTFLTRCIHTAVSTTEHTYMFRVLKWHCIQKEWTVQNSQVVFLSISLFLSTSYQWIPHSRLIGIAITFRVLKWHCIHKECQNNQGVFLQHLLVMLCCVFYSVWRWEGIWQVCIWQRKWTCDKLVGIYGRRMTRCTRCAHICMCSVRSPDHTLYITVPLLVAIMHHPAHELLL